MDVLEQANDAELLTAKTAESIKDKFITRLTAIALNVFEEAHHDLRGKDAHKAGKQ